MCLTIPGAIRSIDESDATDRRAVVDFGGTTRLVHLLYVPEARVGDFVLVHAGFATQRMAAAEARAAIEYAQEMSRSLAPPPTRPSATEDPAGRNGERGP